jgi:hypothetical protein
MEVLRTGLVNIGCENSEAKWYIPWLALDHLFSPQTIKHAIAESGVEPYKREEATERIIKGGKRVFATLIQCGNPLAIVKFLEKDHLQHQALDAKLPLSRSDLVSVLGQPQAELFYRTQWTVSAPLFRGDLSHRDFDKATILPFIRNTKRGSGAFGVVYETTLDPTHQTEIASANMPMVSQNRNLAQR